jgi:hypothetical protein
MQRKPEPRGVRARIWVFTVIGVTLAYLAGRLTNQPIKDPSDQPPLVAITTSPAANKTEPAHYQLSVSPRTNSAIAFSTIVRHLSDPDAHIRLAALEHLDNLKLNPEDILPLFIACLNDSDAEIRANAALRLGTLRMAAADAVPALKQLAFNDTDELVRSRAKDALYNIRFYDFGWQDLQPTR